ncbi:MAG: lysine biosynthesis protein LysW [Candidatus Micrarchaeota archaeon]|nr:lysine biosynthesis protein LysW [Candidatus Micrarchaeota archaeon]MDE1847701.1 lysine biosynthesis protein LysW [Candidatus Micrarchaeota archaeon]MDE1864130.1 lysine biosynthesis protein LysW [Candidatus Micrarchaeota archaeon]
MHCTGCDGRLDIPEDSKVGEITVCKDCGESYELTKKDGDAFGIKPAEKVAEDWGE